MKSLSKRDVFSSKCHLGTSIEHPSSALHLHLPVKALSAFFYGLDPSFLDGFTISNVVFMACVILHTVFHFSP